MTIIKLAKRWEFDDLERRMVARADGDFVEFEDYEKAFNAGAEAMREAAVKLCDSPDVTDIEEYADCIRALPLPEPPK